MAGAVFLLGAVFTSAEWFRGDRMPGGDFPGYAAQLQIVRDAVLEHGRVPRWCVECFGGSSRFTSHAKEWLALPLALAFEPVTATKLAWLLWRLVSALALYAWAVRWLGSPPAGIAAGYAYAFGAVPSAQLAHLDMALAAALLPLFWMALCRHFERGGSGRAALLAALTALLFATHWVYAFVAPFAALAALALRPWPGQALAPGWAGRSALALGLFLLFAASPLAWLLADAPHHWLKAGEDFAPQSAFYAERSPFLFFNRAGWLDAWLATHHPPGLDLEPLGGDARYLGFVVGLLSALGVALAPRAGVLRAVAGCAAALLFFQYWLALGPHTLLWQVASSLGAGGTAQTALRFGLGAAAAGCAIAAARAVAQRRRRRAAGLGAAAALLALPLFSLWSVLSALLPPLETQRSPGHFFDTAPFWLCLLFAAALAALLRRASTPLARSAWATAALLAVAIDFAPSRHPFAAGEPREPLHEAAALLRDLDAEGGTLRALPPPGYGPRSSWILSQSSLGRAWGWLDWQSGRAWAEVLPPAAYGRLRAVAGGPQLEPDLDTLAALRVRYFLLPSQGPALPAPWQREGRGGAYTLWSQSELAPYARVETADGAAPGAAQARRPTPERIELRFAAASGPATLRVSEAHHPWWRARAGGSERPLRRDGATLAVELEAGVEQVELRFERPWAVALADVAGAAAWLLLGPGLALRALWRRRRRGGSPPGPGPQRGVVG